jgi:hypothetical protein
MSSMRRIIRTGAAVEAVGMEPNEGLGSPIVYRGVAAYVVEPPMETSWASAARIRGYVLHSFTKTFRYSKVIPALPIATQLPYSASHRALTRLLPVGRVIAVAHHGAKQRLTGPTVTLRPVLSGDAFRIVSPRTNGLVRPELAEAVEAVFATLAKQRGFTAEKPLEIQLSRGFKAGSPGHGEGRALDIAAIGGVGIQTWKEHWDRAKEAAERLSDPQQRAAAISAEESRNLGYVLYRALQARGGWRVDQDGWRPYRGAMQLFGPWTATEGPWKTMQITDPTPYQRQRLADQQWVLRAHQDHIHLAR